MSCIGPGPAERRAAKHRKHLLELGETCEACEQYAAELIDTITCHWCCAYTTAGNCWTDEHGQPHRDLHQVCVNQFGVPVVNRT